MMEQTTNAYLRTRVMSASPEELRLMLLDGAIKFAHQAREGLNTKNYELSFNGFSQAREIVLELINGIRDDAEPDLVNKVRGVLLFLYRELMEASFHKNVSKVDNVIKILEYERETWVLAMEKIARERGRKPAGRDAPGADAPAGVKAPARPGAPSAGASSAPAPASGFSISA
ncbi:MAG: flagellar export chaperone FliS [Phycisphaerales bacterium]|nr:flagellar export chaperone FliS [Phycisphaerales bacterium]